MRTLPGFASTPTGKLFPQDRTGTPTGRGRSLCFCRTPFTWKGYDTSRRLDILNNRNVLACHSLFRLKTMQLTNDSRGDHGMRKSMLAVASHASTGPADGSLSEP